MHAPAIGRCRALSARLAGLASTAPAHYSCRRTMHEYDILLFELFAIFVAAKVIGEVSERMKLPAVLGEILAGVLIGPYAPG
jgi:hypothetical protein